MRKTGLLFLILLMGMNLFAQVDSYSVKASKTYESNMKTVYLDLDADLDAETARMIESDLEANRDVQKFSFYAKPDFQTCMFTANTGVHEDEIMALINEVVFEATPATAYEIKFADKGRIGDYYKVVFEIDRLPDDDIIKAIHLSLKESNFITDVNYRDLGRFVIFAYEPMYPDQVNQLLEQYGVKISQSSITQK